MFWLIESEEQLYNLSRLDYKEAFIEVIGKDHLNHPVENDLSFIYLHPIHSDKGYIITIDHSEAFKLDFNKVLDVLKKYNTLYTIDKKNTLHYIKLNSLWDIIMPPGNHEIIPNTKSYDNFIRNNIKYPNLNYIYPLSKQYEYFNKLYYKLKKYMNKNNSYYSKFFNNKVSIIFSYIESSGIRIDPNIFEDYFYKTDSDIVYTRYNIKNKTTRPSNSFKGVNFAALNKTNGCRKSIIPREGNILLEFDISSYHPSLIAKLINYDFKGENIHEYFSKLYNVDYETSKELTFKQLYGNVFPQYSHLEFFKRLKEFIKNTWDEFNEKGYYVCPISRYYYYKDLLDDMNPSKLLNYILQNLETSNNIVILWDIIKEIKNLKTKLILYTYDSFLFDFNKEDKHLIKKIKHIFKKHGFQYNINYGENYDFH